jgi:hypothetical protein
LELLGQIQVKFTHQKPRQVETILEDKANFSYINYTALKPGVSFNMTDTQIVADWYNQNVTVEHDRLKGRCLEFSISLRVIHQCVEQLAWRVERPLTILDLGGGTGRYGKPNPF